MADVVKMCDVIDTCEECPRYGDDCDGSDEKLYTHEEAFGMCDYISRADAIEAVMAEGRKVYTSECASAERIIYEEDAVEALAMLPSADAVQGWIPFTRRPMTEEEQKDYPNCTYIFNCVLPDDGDEILVSNGRFVWMETFCTDIDGCYLEGDGDIDEDMAWMPLPTPYKGGDSE